MRIRKTIFGRGKYIPNTFIGGVASTLNTPALVATKLNVNVSRIKGFRIKGSDIEFTVTGTTKYSFSAFGANGVALADQNITYYYDDAGLVSGIPYYAFFYCLNFIDFRFTSSITSIGNYAFSRTKIVNADLSYLSGNITGEWSNSMQFCTELISVNTGDLGYTGTSSTIAPSMFRGSNKLTTAVIKFKYYGQLFRDAWAAGNTFTNTYVLELRGLSHTGCRLSEVYYPNCVKFSNEEFYLNNIITKIDAPKVLSVGVNGGNGSCFRGCGSLAYVDIRSCKYFYRISDIFNNYNFRDACVVGAVVKVHIFMATSNAGAPDIELTYLKNTRGAIVEFYDDSGNYVSTL